MPFCTSCGTQNPDSAKFCAKCGSSLADVATVNPGPVSPASLGMDQPESLQGGDFFRPGRDSDATVPRAHSGLRPGESGQTNFYMAAAGVSSGAKFKRFLMFVVVIAVVGTGLFWLIRFSIQKQKETREALEKKTVQTTPADSVMGTVPGEDGTGGVDSERQSPTGETPKDAATTSKSIAKEPQKTSNSAKSKKKTRKKRR